MLFRLYYLIQTMGNFDGKPVQVTEVKPFDATRCIVDGSTRCLCFLETRLICVLHAFHFNVRIHFVFASALHTPTSGALILSTAWQKLPGDIGSTAAKLLRALKSSTCLSAALLRNFPDRRVNPARMKRRRDAPVLFPPQPLWCVSLILLIVMCCRYGRRGRRMSPL